MSPASRGFGKRVGEVGFAVSTIAIAWGKKKQPFPVRKDCPYRSGFIKDRNAFRGTVAP